MMDRSPSGWRNGAIGCLLLLPTLAAATDQSIPQEKVCDHKVVNKDMLVAFMVEKYPLSLQVYSSHPELAPADPLRKTVAALLRDSAACKDKCGSADQANLDQIRTQIMALLGGKYKAEYSPSTTSDVDRYLSGDAEQDPISCVAQASDNDPPKPKPKPGSKDPNWRLRGDPAQLPISQSTKNFKSTDKALISLSRNEVTDTRTSRVFGYLGYRLPLASSNDNRKALIPYLGINRNIVRVNGIVAADKSTDTVDLGVIANLFRVDGRDDRNGMGHVVNLTSDYLADRLDDSRLVSFQLEYLPVMTNSLNGVISGSGWNAFPTFALRVRAGHYARRAAGAAGDAQENFTRAGAALGIVLAGDDTSLPLEFSNSYTGMKSAGDKPSVSHFKHSLTYRIDRKGLVGLSLNYEHGRREDTLSYVRLWEMALSVRY